ncbi:hypothetical protein PQ455_07295 [Sphingomonas naphthae]|uniref:Uncharacterized protein n=1 Tax=Sphingomonas naphthae TaxID=1813468 RepID=A0ABY7TPI6_9SPHN|nr:hypothetical protein [Sphingomonas naphthae]WCT75013.1 hypothetical protein PQ455_07295 [Sphingomonas naphthae]
MADPTWIAVKLAYLSAAYAERAFDSAHINVCGFRDLPIGPERSALVEAVPGGVWGESQRLQDVRTDAEDRLMAIPSPDAAAFAFKFLVARAQGRGADGWDAMLEAEARGLAPAYPAAEYSGS